MSCVSLTSSNTLPCTCSPECPELTDVSRPRGEELAGNASPGFRGGLDSGSCVAALRRPRQGGAHQGL